MLRELISAAEGSLAYDAAVERARVVVQVSGERVRVREALPALVADVRGGGVRRRHVPSQLVIAEEVRAADAAATISLILRVSFRMCCQFRVVLEALPADFTSDSHGATMDFRSVLPQLLSSAKYAVATIAFIFIPSGATPGTTTAAPIQM